MTDTEDLTAAMVLLLRIEAEQHGDPETVAACDAALNGNAEAAREVARVITSARAMDDDRRFRPVVATIYDVWSPDSGVSLGSWWAESAESALDASARDAGYAGYAEIPSE